MKRSGIGPRCSARLPLGRRLVTYDRLHFGITVAGVAFSVLLMLFLLALYEGVRVESNGYIASRPADAWLAQENTTNFIKASSVMPASVVDAIAAYPGVAEAMPLLRLITQLSLGERGATAIVIGIDPHSSLGPPQLVQGSPLQGRGETVLDRALAQRIGARPGDRLLIQGHAFRVTGLCAGTNMILTQMAFVSYADAQQLLGVSGTTSYVLLRASAGSTGGRLVALYDRLLPHTHLLTQREFADNNMQELSDGLLPLLATVAILGAGIALSVLTLLLYSAILERRECYALLKAIGAPRTFLYRLILQQSLAAVSSGVALGMAAYAVCAPITRHVVPVIVLSLSPAAIGMVTAMALLVGVTGALVPLQRVSRIYPAELFRA